VCVSPSCFPADATVTTDAGVVKAMTDVRLGDRVLVARPDGTLGYEEVYLNTHKDRSVAVPYVALTLASGRTLTLSPRHFIPVASGPQQAWAEHVAKGADEVRAGDFVWSRADDGRMVLDHRVAATATRVAIGAYDPLTMNGTIVVDGVVASAHSDWFLDGVVSADTQAKVYQAILAPVRVAYRALGPARMEAITEGWGVVDFVREATTPDGGGPGLGRAGLLAAALLAGGGLLAWRRRRPAAAR
jgi:Hint module